MDTKKIGVIVDPLEDIDIQGIFLSVSPLYIMCCSSQKFESTHPALNILETFWPDRQAGCGPLLGQPYISTTYIESINK